MTQTKERVIIPTTKNYIVMPDTGEIILPPRSDVCPEDLPPPNDIFFYGWRFVEHRVNGTTATARMPLTLEDVIHPQLGDYIVQSERHAIICNELWNRFLTIFTVHSLCLLYVRCVPCGKNLPVERYTLHPN